MIVEIITKMFILMLLIISITKNQWFDRKPFVWISPPLATAHPGKVLIGLNDIFIEIIIIAIRNCVANIKTMQQGDLFF